MLPTGQVMQVVLLRSCPLVHDVQTVADVHVEQFAGHAAHVKLVLL